ncbi:MAG: Xaa-Pro peptidase family protein [Spirochaetaceae bacterium]|jgi:Xaa-Pro dipeptidase|nr:Xaa-Pro peptidase family protein [Spirochaetaceae bacterium]
MTQEDMTAHRRRRGELARWLRDNGLGAAVFADKEGGRDPAIRYFTGHPSDAVLVIAADGRAALSPWDEHLAALMADADLSVPYTAFDRDSIRAARGLLGELAVPPGAAVEIPPNTSHPDFLKYAETLGDFRVLCRDGPGAHQKTRDMRALKDEQEIALIREACAVTDGIIGMIEDSLRSGAIRTEIDAALLIERESRLRGGEGPGFGTLAAGPGRSFGIHCFPPCTGGPFPAPGLSILDFGVLYRGYTSDVTLTVTQGRLTAGQEKQLELVLQAYDEALGLYRPGVPVAEPARRVESRFAQAGRELPHGLGHGIGLEIHEFPFVRPSAPAEAVFLPGMTVTLEPGLYDPTLGGVRFENSILITEAGNEPLTRSRIIRL